MKTRIIVLAAGKGRRMNSESPKILERVKDKPLIAHLVESIRESGIDDEPVVVVGRSADEIRNVLGDGCQYAVQDEPMGTGHATQCAEEILSKDTGSVIVLYGDQPYIKPGTIKKLAEIHANSGGPLTMATTSVENFEGANEPFYSFGRIVRDGQGKIEAVVEKKDATPAQLEIREVNPGYYCFNAGWLWENLKKVKNENAAREYYLTDLVHIAIERGENISSMNIEPKETIGVNTQEDLARVRELT